MSAQHPSDFDPLGGGNWSRGGTGGVWSPAFGFLGWDGGFRLRLHSMDLKRRSGVAGCVANRRCLSGEGFG